MTQPNEQCSEVIQADREAAAELLAYHDEPTNVLYAITQGMRDEHPVVLAFARHREAHSRPEASE